MGRKQNRRPWGVWLLLAAAAAAAVWMTLRGNRTANGLWNLAGFALLVAAILLSRLLLGRLGEATEPEETPEPTEEPAPVEPPNPKPLPPEPPEATPFTRRMQELVVVDPLQLRYYQLILGQKQLHLIYLGDGMTPEADRWLHMLPTSWDDEKLRTAKRRVYSIDYDQLHELTVEPVCPGARETESCGTLKLRSRIFSATLSMHAQPADATPEELREFFRPAGNIARIETRKYDRDRAALSQIRADKRSRAAAQDAALLRKLRPLEYLLPILAFPLTLLMLTSTVAQPLLVLLYLTPFALLILMPNYFSVGKLLANYGDKSPIQNTVDLTYAIFLSGFPLALNILRFHVESIAPLIVLSVVFSVIMTVLITRRLPKLPNLWFARVTLLVILLFTSAGMLLSVNSLFEWRRPEPTPVRVMQKYVGDGPTLVVRDPGGAEFTRTVDSDLYWEARLGGHAVLVRRTGALGIVWSELRSGEDWANQNPDRDPWAID